MFTHQRTLSAFALIVFFIFSGISAFAQTSPDSAQPVISGVVATGITGSSAIISWTTDVPATSRIDYGATTNYEVPSIIDSGLRTSHQISLSPLDTNTTYHYRVRSTNASGRERVDVDNTFTTNSPLDYIPPDEIVSLRVSTATVTSLTITWIEPGDNGSAGTSTSYEIRASSTLIPDVGALSWWNNATVWSGAPAPHGPGLQATYTAQNLATSTTYYIAVRARDKAGNISGISIPDIKSGITLAAPQIVIAPVVTPSPATSAFPTPSGVGTSTVSVGAVPISIAPSPIVPMPPISPQASPATLFTGNLFYGMRNESVKTLQRILIAKGFLTAGSDSGFFGSLTQRGVQKFQCSEKIVCSGSARTTGYGFVGARTRAKLGGI